MTILFRDLLTFSSATGSRLYTVHNTQSRYFLNKFKSFRTMCTGGAGATSPRYLVQLRIQDPLGETSVGSSPAQVKLWDFDYTVKKISPTPDIRGKTPIQADLVSFFDLFFRRKNKNTSSRRTFRNQQQSKNYIFYT